MPFRARSHRRPFRDRAAREGSAASLADPWRAWVAENTLLGVSPEDLLATLTQNGVPPALGRREIECIRQSPLVAGARRVARRVHRHELVARLKREVAALASRPGEVERRSGISGAEFFDRYYAGGVPVVLTDALAAWPAVARWSPAYFKERFGDVELDVSTGRDLDPECDTHVEARATAVRLGDFCDRVAAAGATNDIYLLANNRAFDRPALAPLLEDIRAPHAYLDDRRDPGWTSLWFGPAGTLTPLHHDTANVLFCQVFGRKRIVLFPSSELFLTDPMKDGFFSPIDPERPDFDAFPELAGACRNEVVLSPGEALFIPVGYWHHVRALDVSINISFTQFKLPNRFDWYAPGKTE